MRLYLSSYKWGDDPEKLFDLIEGTRAGIVMNATDLYPTEESVQKYAEDAAYFKERGFSVEMLDLREYFGQERDLARRMKGLDVVWVRGGNTFVLRRAMQQSGFDTIIMELLASDSIVYAGYSAGSCILGTTLEGLDLVDDPLSVPDGYDQAILWDGLGVVDYTIVPHYKSEHPEAELVDETIEYLEDSGIPYKPIRDGEAIIVDERA